MASHAKGTFEVKSFDEQTAEEFDNGTKLTRARIVQTMTGGLDGESTFEYVMHYRQDGTASFAGYQYFVGQVDDHTGTFVQQLTGTYDNTEARTLRPWCSAPGPANSPTSTGRGCRWPRTA